MSKSVQLFDGLSDKQIKDILNPILARKYKKNHILIFEEDPIDRVYIVKSGTLKIYRTYEDKEIILDFVKKHEVIGEVELFSKSPALSSVEVTEDAEIYHLSQVDFIALIYKNKTILENIFRIHHQRFETLNKQIRNLTFYSVHTRVCRVLLDFLENNETSNDFTIKNINQSTIASMIGVTRESVSKAFKDLQDERILSLQPKTITILDRDKLKEYANFD
ncbi:CRP/FNR family transcriptional regulator, anaerobic regulatory protein [Carnobacterium iners]|uniref:CRP/FNR family transcriptional regulator, anaerobic regulatory protein n=1 Tax=Carnobacterium iners TaxID=1073423 RepID=A0A1X7MZ27_9LACT|nr:Crp/Fnr family transcriptional regulator [Carnobacterium iners]SEK18858.1 CRP/FNR family transcriptional regulator, anaerobic regulatory protein [Carnobacterium iners]SMH29764.1 CRP/FNR family transcriptional regulator, anaerobic regulatory protein [Carnobacterium iners]